MSKQTAGDSGDKFVVVLIDCFRRSIKVSGPDCGAGVRLHKLHTDPQALTQLLNDTRWGALDFLIVDMPPGTGDIQLSLAQSVPVTGAIIVTTPQDVALSDARRGIEMFRKVEVPILGVVENMSIHVCSNCGHSEHIFGDGGASRLAEKYQVNLLGELPLDVSIREQCDEGKPAVVADPDGKIAELYLQIASRVVEQMANAEPAQAAPNIIISDD